MPDRLDLADDLTLPLRPSGHKSPRVPREAIRYQILEELARGGMGLVYRAVDPALGRDLALKVLREDYADDAAMTDRFLEEARVAGRLQHPGIVPVHDIGRFADDRPFFTMKLVEGRTLAEILAQRHGTRDNLPRLLSIFEAVCQALAYAHSQEVIHRDLKPANIMVGAFGEVQVMDWGLAKVIGGADAPAVSRSHDTAVVPPVRPGQTVVGGAIGTPAYMAPEQARGDASARQVDVFGLGGILSEILTGMPPFALPHSMAVWLLAPDRDFRGVHERLLASGHDTELVALARGCLAEDPADRPADASAVAGRIRAYLSGVQERLRLSEIDRAAADARAKAERRSRRLLLGLGVVGLLLVGLCVAVGAWWDTRRQATNQRIAILMAQVEQFGRQAENTSDPGQALPLWREAGSLVDQANEVLATGLADEEVRRGVHREQDRIHALIDLLTHERQFLDRLAQIRLMRDDEIDDIDIDGAYRQAFREHGLDVDRYTVRELGDRILRRPTEFSLPLVEALDDWCQESRRKKLPENQWRPLLELASMIDDNPWRKNVRAELTRTQAAGLGSRHLAVDAVTRFLMPGTLVTQLFVSGVETIGRREQLHRLARSADESQLTAANSRLLASLLLQEGDTAEAVRLLRMAQKRNPGDLWLNYELGHAETRVRHPNPAAARQGMDEAIRYLTAARAIKPEVGHSLAHALGDRGRKAEAIELFRELIRLNPRHAGHHGCLGVMLVASENYVEAEKILLRAIELDPRQSLYRTNLGVCLAKQKRFSHAERRYREALALSPENSSIHLRLGRLLMRVRREEEGLTHFERAVASSPDDLEPRLELARGMDSCGRPERAITIYREALRLHPNSGDLRLGLGGLLSTRTPQEAIRLLGEATDLDPRSDKAREMLGILLLQEGRFAEAVVHLRKALELNPKNVRAAKPLPVALIRAGRNPEALAWYEEAISRFPDESDLSYDYAIFLSDLGRNAEAERLYRNVCKVAPNHAEAYCNLGLLLRDRGQFAEALTWLEGGHEIGIKRSTWAYPSKAWIADCKELHAIEGRLDDILSGKSPATSHRERATTSRACRYKGRHAGLVQIILEAIALDPGLEHDLRKFNRGLMAESAILAGTRKSSDSTTLSAMRCHALRKQGLTWLRADLVARRGERDSRQRFAKWLTNPAYESVRDPALLARIPAEERRDWMAFWADVRKSALPE